MEKKSNGLKIGAMVVGLIGGILSFLGGLCVTACAELADEITEGATNYAVWGWVLGVGGAVIAIVGAAMSLKNGTIAGILMIVSLVMSVVLVIIFGPVVAYMSIICAVMILIAAILAFVGESKAKKG